MPVTGTSPIKFGIIVNGEFKELGESVESVTLEPVDVPQCIDQDELSSMFADIRKVYECKFDVKGSVFLKALRTTIYGKNNWRKMHGLPMIRKFRKKK